MIQRRNSRRFILSELKSDEDQDGNNEQPIEITVDSEDQRPPSPDNDTFAEHSPFLFDAPPTQNEVQKWRSIKSLRAQIT